MNDLQLAAATRMREVLGLWPCQCSTKYEKEVQRRVTTECARCKAMREWDDLNKPAIGEIQT